MNKARRQPKESSFGKTNPYEDREGLVYARVSSKRQEVEGSGLQSQEERCIKDLNSIGVPYSKSFLDSFTGGGDFMRRPAMNEMLAYIDARPHKKFVVIFDDLKRFARDVEFHLKLRTALKVRDVVVRCLNYNFDESPEGRFAEVVMAGHAELERHQNSRQVVQKMCARLDAGYWPFGTKKGYKQTPDPAHGKLAVPLEPYATLLKNALEGFATGKFVRKLDACKYLVENGFWTKQRPERYIDKFDSYLRDPFYSGYIQYPMWEVGRRVGKHVPIISQQTFELNQKRLGKRELTKVRIDHSKEFILRGLISCEGCGGHLTAAWAKGRRLRHGYYFCQNGKCPNYRKSARMLDVEGGFDKILKKHRLKNEVSKVVELVFNRIWEEELSSVKKQKALNQKQKEQIEKKAKQLTEIVINAKSARLKRLYESELEKIAEELDNIEGQQVEEIDLTVPYRTALQKSKKFLKSPYIAWKKSSPLEKQQLYYFIFDKKIPYSIKSGYRTEEIPNAIRLFEEFVATNSHDVEMGGIEPPCKDESE